VTLFGSLAAVAWHRRTDIDKSWLAYGLPSALIIVVFAYGFVRLAMTRRPPRCPSDSSPAITAGVGVGGVCGGRARPGQGGGEGRRPAGEDRATRPRGSGSSAAAFGRVASDNAVYLLAGAALLESDHKENRAWLFAPTGELIADYAKHHLIPGLEASFTSGREFVVRAVGTNQFGIAICKDMDFASSGAATLYSGWMCCSCRPGISTWMPGCMPGWLS